MTQAEIDRTMIQSHRCSEPEAAELRALTGAVVARTGPGTRGGCCFVGDDKAHMLAAALARQYPGNLYSVFVLAADYYDPPRESASPPESEAGA